MRMIGAAVSGCVRAMRDRRGIAAVEFALLLPLMLLMYVGATDVTRGVMASRDVDILSRTVSDLVAQSQTNTITASQISTAFSAASGIMRPFSTTNLTMTVSAVTIGIMSGTTTCCQAAVSWSYTQGGTLRTCAAKTTSTSANILTQVADGTRPSPTTIPASIINANTSAGYGYSASKSSYLIIADVTYTYTPLFNPTSITALFGPAATWLAPTISKTTYMVPRLSSGGITLSTPIGAGSGQSGCTSN